MNGWPRMVCSLNNVLGAEMCSRWMEAMETES